MHSELCPSLKARDAKGPSSDGDGDGDGDAFLVKGVGRGQEGAWTATTRTAPPGYPNGNVLLIAYVQASAT